MAKKTVATQEQAQTPAIDENKFELKEITYDDVKVNVCPDATEREINFFIQMCLSKKLDPFKKEIYLIKHGTGPAYIVIDFKKRIHPAYEHPQFNGFKYGVIVASEGKVIDREGEFYNVAKERLLGAWCTIWRKDWPEPFTVKLPLDFWDKNQAYWKVNKPHMICKCALTQCIELCFPELPPDSLPEDIQITDTVIDSEPEGGEGASEAIEAPETKEDTKPPENAEDAQRAFYIKRNKIFFKHMYDEHNLSDPDEIKAYLTEKTNKPVESIKEFIRDEEPFLLWAERDKYPTGKEAINDLFPDGHGYRN